MEKNDKFEVSIFRDYRIVKSNDLIQKSRFELSAQEQKIILCLISKIKPSDKIFREYEFDIREFCRLCGIDYENGKNYKNARDAIKKLSDKSLWVTLDTGKEVLLRWINEVSMDKKSGLVKISLHNSMKPYLLELKSRFTQYELVYTLGMKSQYAIRLYELLKSYEYREKWLVEIDRLKRMLSAENYDRYADFKRFVIEIGLREINNLSDICVEYEAIKCGRKYNEIKFTVRPKENQEQTTAWLSREFAFNSKR